MKLQDYIYLETDHHQPLGWARDTDDILRIVNEWYWSKHFEDMPLLLHTLCTLVMRTCQSYYQFPDQSKEVRHAVRQAQDGQFYTEPMRYEQGSDQRGILAVFSPMMYKGMDSQLATINVSPYEHIYLQRINEDVAIPKRTYINLLCNDAESIQRTGYATLQRRTEGRPQHGNDNGTRLYLKTQRNSVPLRDVTKRDIRDAMNQLKTKGDAPITNIETTKCLNDNPFIVTLEPKCDDFLDAVDEIRRAVPLGVMTVAKQTAWQHVRNGNIFIGSYPHSYGYHERICERVGCIYPNLVSTLPGVILQFHNKEISYMIVRE